MKRPDLLVLVAVWEFITAFGAFIGAVAISVFAFPSVVWYAGPGVVESVAGLSIGLLFVLCYLGVALAGGIGLLMGKEWGWIVSIVHAALSLFAFPFGTVIGILVLIYLFKADVRLYFHPES